MNPAILARLFAAQQQPQPHRGSPLTLEQEPGDLWAPKSGSDLGDLGPDVTAQRRQSIDNAPMPPSDYQFLDRVEGDDQPLGVMFGQDAGEPMGNPHNVPMSRLPHGAQEGSYISPLDIRPPVRGGRMTSR